MNKVEMVKLLKQIYPGMGIREALNVQKAVAVKYLAGEPEIVFGHGTVRIYPAETGNTGIDFREFLKACMYYVEYETDLVQEIADRNNAEA